MNDVRLKPDRLASGELTQAMRLGWRLFQATRGPSLAYTSTAFCIGLILFAGIVHLGLSPLSLPLAFGFMLTAPAMLGGFFRIAIDQIDGQPIGIATPFRGFLRTPPMLWVVALFCGFVFLIWMTDAGVLYSFTLGGRDWEPAWAWLGMKHENIRSFWLWGSLMGGFLAFVIFCVAAFSVPLLYERRSGPIEAVHASVRGVFSNFRACMTWAVALCLITLTAVLLLPLLLITLPVCAYTGFFLYRKLFPPAD